MFFGVIKAFTEDRLRFPLTWNLSTQTLLDALEYLRAQASPQFRNKWKAYAEELQISI